MGVNALQIQMAALVADTEAAILSPSAQKMEALAEAAAEISPKRGADFQHAANLYNQGDTQGGLSALRVAVVEAENWFNRMMNS